MEKWKVKTIEPVAEFTGEGCFSTVEVEADFIESVPNGTLVFWRWIDKNKTKKLAVAIFSAQNLVSAINETLPKLKEESDEQTSETTV